MKRKILLVVVSSLALLALAGCGQPAGETSPPPTNVAGNENAPAPAP